MGTRNLLVFLDCLLDTTLGTLATLNTAHRTKVLSEKTPYFSRVMDDFEWLGEGTTKDFKARYERRDLQVLKASFKTLLIPHLTQLTASILMSAHEHPEWNGVTIHVNTWPYDLTVTQSEMFKNVLKMAIGGDDEGEGNSILEPDLVMVSIPLEEITFDRMTRDWQAVYMYDFIAWTDLLAHTFEGNEMKAVKVEMHVPALFRELPDKATLRKPDGSHINPFYEAKRNMALWVNVNYVSPQLYSIPNPEEFLRKKL